MNPVHDLASAKSLIEANEVEIGTRRATERVLEVMGFSTATEAQEFICQGILKLTPDNFVRSIHIAQFDGTYDEYGIRIENIPWYIKFTIYPESELDDEHVNIPSFHPTESQLQTNSELLEQYTEETI